MKKKPAKKSFKPLTTIPKRELKLMADAFAKLAIGYDAVIHFEFKQKFSPKIRINWESDVCSRTNAYHVAESIYDSISILKIDSILTDKVKPLLDKYNLKINKWNREFDAMVKAYGVDGLQAMDYMYDYHLRIVNKKKRKKRK